jgi:hypothetical protein
MKQLLIALKATLVLGLPKAVNHPGLLHLA